MRVNYFEKRKTLSDVGILRNCNFLKLSDFWFKKISDLSHEMRVPMSMILMRALNNELESRNAFEPMASLDDLPTDITEEDSNSHSHALFNFLRKHPGLNLEQLIFLRFEYGVHDIEKLKRALAFLLSAELVEGYFPGRAKFPYPDDYRVFRVYDKTIKKKLKDTFEKKGPLSDL